MVITAESSKRLKLLALANNQVHSVDIGVIAGPAWIINLIGGGTVTEVVFSGFGDDIVAVAMAEAPLAE